jgi:8-oxo-dGTP pyrophosphatase MutT (NUDIX family)
MVKKCICASCILFKDGKILLHRHKKLGKWMYPGGHVDENETPTDAAAREVLEETGYRARLVGRRPMGLEGDANVAEEPLPLAILYETVRYSAEMHMHFDMIYMGVAEDGSSSAVAANESKEFMWVSKDDDISTIDTFENMKKTLAYAFGAAKSIGVQ